MRKRSAPPLNVAQQLINLRISPICKGVGAIHRGKLTWEFDAQPDVLGRVYRIRIEYEESSAPRVYLIEPNLKLLAEGRRLPHVYEQEPARLCLYLPGAREWSASKRISETIVPWAFLWLWYFEEWLVSDDWKGGGIHPTARLPRQQKSRSRLPQGPRHPDIP
jgi:hypothetical protein